MIRITVILGIMAILCVGMYRSFRIQLFYSLAITFGTTLYHFAMRLLIGLSLNAIFHNHINYQKKWFQPRKFESRIYQLLHVNRWKKYIPTFSPEDFKVDKQSIETVIQVTCQSEIVHEIIMVLSFIPLILAVKFDGFSAFFITSVIAALIDSVFVILQRYNRPRLMKLLERTKNR